jgi:M6 family metalloprotease-like protein
MSAILVWSMIFVPSADVELAPPPRVYADFDLSEYKLPAKATTVAVKPPAAARTPSAPPYLGLHLVEKEGAVVIGEIDSTAPAAKAGAKVGDVVKAVQKEAVASLSAFRAALFQMNPGDSLELSIRRGEQDLSLRIALASTSSPLTEKEETGPKKGGWDNRLGGTFKKDRYRLGVILIGFPDFAINPKITPADWEQSLFSQGVYTDKSATGQPVFGSLRDYYLEQSCGMLAVEGKVFAPVKLARKRADYATATTRIAILTEALDAVAARDGANAVKGLDGFCYVYAGESGTTQRSSVLWPHRASFTHKNERYSYFIIPEGGPRMNSISTICHEFGHMLGLPDLYAKPEVPGMEGAGAWCAMSQQMRGGRPQHLCAWSKEQMGWLKPAVIDPSVPQKLLLEPIEGKLEQCYKALVRADGSEYLLLENRSKSGFDKDLQGEGLLIWRVVDGRPLLEESHGIAGPNGPRAFPDAVPYPSRANSSYTPYTIPSSQPFKPEGKPTHITNIRRLPDRTIAFQIGYEYW